MIEADRAPVPVMGPPDTMQDVEMFTDVLPIGDHVLTAEQKYNAPLAPVALTNTRAGARFGVQVAGVAVTMGTPLPLPPPPIRCAYAERARTRITDIFFRLVDLPGIPVLERATADLRWTVGVMRGEGCWRFMATVLWTPIN